MARTIQRYEGASSRARFVTHGQVFGASLQRPAAPSGVPAGWIVFGSLLTLTSIIVTLWATFKKAEPLAACAAENAGIMDKLKAAELANKAIEAGGTDPWLITAQGWAQLLACPGLPGAFTKDTPPIRIKLFAASVLYVVGLLKAKQKIATEQETTYIAEVTKWASSLGVTL